MHMSQQSLLIIVGVLAVLAIGLAMYTANRRKGN